ncbi:MAG: hypothetical protein VB122_04540, partial [Erysipelotrichales bacterium]|nr:hypothetical protein [Erysipelotrichales bacterium]
LIVMLLASCNTSKKVVKDSELVDMSTSSTQERKQEEKKFFNSLVIDTTSISEMEITITETTRTELRDSSGTTIKEQIKETKTNTKKQNNGLTMAQNDSVDKKSNLINRDSKNDIKKNDKTKETKEVKANTNWIYKVVIVLAFLVVIWLNRKKIIKKLFQFKSR